MGTGFIRLLLGILGLIAAFAVRPAIAETTESVTSQVIQYSCHAHGDESLATMAARTTKWKCGANDWRNGDAVSWLKFSAANWRGQSAPTHFVSRITRFQAITLAVVDAHGQVRALRYDSGSAKTLSGGPSFSLPLPQIGPASTAVLVRIERPNNLTVLTEARLTANPESAGWSQTEIMLLALLAGMLVTPLLFDINFFLVLRERFILAHAAMVVAMCGYLLFSGGLISVFVTLPAVFLAVAGPLCWALGVGCSLFFMNHFLEAKTLGPELRRAVHWAAWWSIAVPGFFALQLDWTQPLNNAGYYYAFVPVIVLYFVALGRALSSGSRSAKFLALGWLPILCAAIERVLRGNGFYIGPSSLDHLLFLALALEVVVIALGVADRFLVVRRDRDRALLEARLQEERAERDPLTGLLNRRAIEDRFGHLREAGFNAVAVIDLDHFKHVNDDFGHAVGDTVLCSVAAALAPDEDTLAMRLGGEEFLLLLRGPDSVERAEHRRRAITTRIAADTPGLNRLITASMGLVSYPDNEGFMGEFAGVYAHCDRLLYEAKRAGRNRTMRETIRTFREPVLQTTVAAA